MSSISSSAPSNTSLRSSAVIIAGPAGDLETLLEEPLEELRDTAAPPFVAIVCHPHPLFGGTMTNKVVHVLARTFNELHAPVVRFNFRGVGKSAGAHDDGRGEVEDVLAILNWCSSRWLDTPLWLAGFSFGAAMALQAALVYPVTRLITVAPALRWLQSLRAAPISPWLIVQGDHDELVDAQAVEKWAQALNRPPQIELIAGAEHFFHGKLNALRDAVKHWVCAA